MNRLSFITLILISMLATSSMAATPRVLSVPVLGVGSKVIKNVELVGTSRTGFSFVGEKYHQPSVTKLSRSQGKLPLKVRFRSFEHIRNPDKEGAATLLQKFRRDVNENKKNLRFVTPEFLRNNVFPVHRIKYLQLAGLHRISDVGFDLSIDIPTLIRLNDEVYIGINGMTRRYTLSNGLVPVTISTDRNIWGFQVAKQALITAKRRSMLPEVTLRSPAAYSNVLQRRRDEKVLSKNYYLASLFDIDEFRYYKTQEQLKKLEDAIDNLEQHIRKNPATDEEIQKAKEAVAQSKYLVERRGNQEILDRLNTLENLQKAKDRIVDPLTYEKQSLFLSEKNFYPPTGIQGRAQKRPEAFESFIKSPTLPFEKLTSPLPSQRRKSFRSQKELDDFQQDFLDAVLNNQTAAYEQVKRMPRIDKSLLRPIRGWSDIPQAIRLKRFRSHQFQESDWLFNLRLADIRTLIVEKYADQGFHIPLNPGAGSWTVGQQFTEGIHNRLQRYSSRERPITQQPPRKKLRTSPPLHR